MRDTVLVSTIKKLINFHLCDKDDRFFLSLFLRFIDAWLAGAGFCFVEVKRRQLDLDIRSCNRTQLVCTALVYGAS